MKHEIIKTENYLLVVEETNVPKIGKWYYNSDNSNLFIIVNDYPLPKSDIVISHLPLNGSPILEGVDLLPPLSLNQTKYIKEYQQYDDGTHVCIAYSNGDWFCDCGLEGNEEAEKNADLILDKLNDSYTEEDLRIAIQQAFLSGVERLEDFGKVESMLMKNIQQPKYPIGFECEVLDTAKIGFTSTVPMNLTTTTPEGHTQWIGTYIYE
jgi:hypothetical protein